MGTGDPGRPARRVRGMGTVDPGRHSRVRRGQGRLGRVAQCADRSHTAAGRRPVRSRRADAAVSQVVWAVVFGGLALPAQPPPTRAEHARSSTGELAAAPRERAASSQRSNPIDLSRLSLPTTSRYPTHRSTAAVLPNLAPLPLYYFLPYADWHCQTCTAHAKPWRETVEAGGTTGLRLPNDQ